MKNKISLSALRQNRRSFLKSQAMMGFGIFTAGRVIPLVSASPHHPVNNDQLTQDELRAKYEECLGGPCGNR
jgi:hypothetical protein